MRKRTQAEYIRLYKNPNHLDPPHASGGGAEVTIFPNGEREVWIKSPEGDLGFTLHVSHGPAGLGLRVTAHTGRPMVTVFGESNGEPADLEDKHLELCQYRADSRSQSFKRWYAHRETESDIEILGEKYRRHSLESAS